ncbi:MAG: PH domain-containing protein [Candidatus Gracilibacteria bacterium]|nr:PH domain-containing protein [Candidatus Gracilibacteria bacterium]
MQKDKWNNIHFEGKHEDEKILHYCLPSKKQTVYELLKILMPMVFIYVLLTVLMFNDYIPFSVGVVIYVIITLGVGGAVGYKLYRAHNNFLYITSKRILFHGMEGLFKDYVKKISYDNVRNVNYFTGSILGKIFNYGTLEIQSSHGGIGDITVYHIDNGKMLTHYIDKLIHIPVEERGNFPEFDANYFKDWK